MLFFAVLEFIDGLIIERKSIMKTKIIQAIKVVKKQLKKQQIKKMKNKTLGTGILCSLGFTMLVVIFEADLSYSTTENLYALAGIAFLFFGIWGSLRLIKREEN